MILPSSKSVLQTIHALSRSPYSRIARRNLASLVNGRKPAQEPLHLSVDDGYGFARINPGDDIGQDNRFSIVRRLGWGMYSSTWLAKDHQDEKHVAIKVLTGFATRLYQEGLFPELDVLRKLSATPGGAEPKEGHCLSLHSNFLHPGQLATGPHLCLVTDVFAGDVEHLKRLCAPRGFPPILAKRILLHTLKGLNLVHSEGVVHADLKHDNILFDTSDAAGAEKPLPIPSVNEALDRTFVIADFGNAQFIGKPIFDEIAAEALRAPETLLRAPWDEKVDIWIFGCLAFEFLCGRPLFRKRLYPEHRLDAISSHLWRMQCFTNEKFEPEQLKDSKLGRTYFDHTFQLKSHPPIISHDISKILGNLHVLDDEQLLTAASFIHRCLRINPHNRASAKELLDDPIWEGVEENASATGKQRT